MHLEFENGMLVKVNGDRYQYIDGNKLLELIRVLGKLCCPHGFVNGTGFIYTETMQMGGRFNRPLAQSAYGAAVEPYASALHMIREAVGEIFGPVASMESEDATLLRGPEPHHDAEGIIEALQRVKTHIKGLEAVRAELERMGDKVAELQMYNSAHKDL